MHTKVLFFRTAAAFMMVLMLLAALPVPPALAATSGPFNPGTVTDVNAVGTVTWSNPGNIVTPGTPYATASVPSGAISHYLQASNYSFNIPFGSTIDGITVRINRQSVETSNPSIQDSVVRLLKGGVITGDNKAQIGTNWSQAAFGIATYGGVNDKWGTTWEASDINANNFGVVLSVTDAHPSQSRTAVVDYMQITVTYTPPNSTTTVNCGSGDPVVTYGSSLTCVATVVRTGGTFTPTGSVAWTSSGAGNITTSPCTLSNVAPGTASCQVTYQPTQVGTGAHTLTATYSGDANFSGSQGTQIVTVNKKDASVTADPKTKTYGDDNPGLTATVTGEVVGDPINYTLATTALKLSDVGSYPITVSLGANPNYNVTATDSTLTVDPKAAAVVADAKTKTYGDDNPALTAAETGAVVGGDPLSYTLATTALKLSDVGPYPITVTLGANPNYNVTATDSTLTVDPKAAAVVADAKTKTYGDDNPTLTAAETGAVVGGDPLSYTLATTALKLSDVGPYPITVTLGANPNYNVTATDGTLTVDPKAASVTADPKSRQYGDDNPTLTATMTGEVSGGDVISYTLATTALKLSDVGSYPITVSLGANPNYNVTATDGTLTVTPRAVTVLADAKSKLYGQPDPALTYQVISGTLLAGDVFTGELTRVGGEALGQYDILQGTLALPAYYDLTYIGAKLTIQAAGPALTLVITPTPLTFTKAGNVIQYAYVLTNSGNVPLEGPFTVEDDKATGETCPPAASLSVGAALTCTGSYTITLADVRAGSVTNTATAAGAYASEAVVSDPAQATVKTYKLYLPLILK
jgi:hypothetical protein